MYVLRRSGLFAIIVLLAVLLTACGVNLGSTATTTTQSTKTPTATGALTISGNMDTMQGIAITPNTSGNAAALINTGKATINGLQVNVLLTSKGFPVYTYKGDTPLTSTCMGACAKAWPPVLASEGMMTVSSSVTLPKMLSVHQTANGAQVFYDSHALYTYVADKKEGQAMGHGQGMKWYLVDSMLSTMASTKPATATTNAGTTTANTGTANMMQGIPITLAMTGNMGAFIHVGQAAINGRMVNVLTTNKGFAIYYYKSDTALTATCTGACAKDWPPVLAPQGMMTISSSVTLPKLLSVHQTANGAQVFYDDHALYTYATDQQAGQALGRGQDMLWYMVGFLL